MTYAEFHNGLRILINLEREDVPFLTETQWFVFSEDPFVFFIRAGDEVGARLWDVMQRRMQK